MKDCDFIPASHHVRRAQHHVLRMRISFISVMVVIMILWVTAHHHQLSSAEAMLTDVLTQRDQVEILLARKAEMESERTALMSRKQLVECLEDDVNAVVLLSELSRSMPQTVVLTKLILTAPGVSQFGIADATPKEFTEQSKIGAPGASVAATANATELARPPEVVIPRLNLFGVASEAAEVIKFAATLERSALVARVSMQVKGSVDWAGRRVEQFEMSCELVEQTRKKP